MLNETFGRRSNSTLLNKTSRIMVSYSILLHTHLKFFLLEKIYINEHATLRHEPYTRKTSEEIKCRAINNVLYQTVFRKNDSSI